MSIDEKKLSSCALSKNQNIYRPQRSCGKVIVLHLSVILSTGHPHQTPPRASNPLIDTPWQTPPWVDTPPPSWHPTWQTPWSDNPLGRLLLCPPQIATAVVQQNFIQTYLLFANNVDDQIKCTNEIQPISYKKYVPILYLVSLMLNKNDKKTP